MMTSDVQMKAYHIQVMILPILFYFWITQNVLKISKFTDLEKKKIGTITFIQLNKVKNNRQTA